MISGAGRHILSRSWQIGLLTVAALGVGAAIRAALAGPEGSGVRPPAAAGRFYPADADVLTGRVRRLIAAAPRPKPAAPRPSALIVPHAGYPYSGAVAAAAFRRLEGVKVRRVVVIGVSHAGPADPSVWVDDVSAYAIPGRLIAVDRLAVAELEKAGLPVISGRGAREHSIEVELPFLAEVLPEEWKLVPILVSTADADACAGAAEIIKRIIDDRTVVCVSSDFTHYGAPYGYVPFAGSDEEIAAKIRELDSGAIDRILAKDAAGFAEYCVKKRATICGRGPILVLLGLLDDSAKGTEVAYATSAEKTGDWSISVSYAAIIFTGAEAQGPTEDNPMPEEKSLSAGEKETLLSIARASLEACVRGEKQPEESQFDLTDALREKRGAFVTLTKNKALRGCIGYVEPIKPLWQAVMENAANAALRDPRFRPVAPAELGQIHIEISAMSPLRAIKDVSEIEVGRRGLMITRGGRRGLLLPQVATEYGWDREEFLSHTCLKAGLPAGAWKDEGTKIEVFSAEVFGEEGAGGREG